MKITIAIVASFLGLASALPQQYYQQQTLQAPQTVPDKKYYTGKIQLDNLHLGPGYTGEIKYTTTSSSAPVSVPLPGSDTFTQQQATYWTSVSKQLEDQQNKKYYTGFSVKPSVTITSNVAQPEKKYYTGLVYHPAQETSTASVAQPEKKYYTGLVYHPSQETLSAPVQNQMQQMPTAEKKYYTGLVYHPGQELASSAMQIESPRQLPAPQQYYTGLVYKPMTNA
ncbi:uncharacterized protein LOC142230557 [Haematobia irritans]|uniref:uncharacterized protein LOC142230557 n=1 Tax=Haematobia irritans TaxID=7368 RepID=UPI003F4FE4D0